MIYSYSFWVLLSSWLVLTGWVLSIFKGLSPAGYLASLILFVLLLLLLASRSKEPLWRSATFNLPKFGRRFRRPIPCIYLLCLLAATLGGALYAPTNYDGLCYRIPRILHWWHAGQWHWIGGFNVRMDYSSAGFEWMMLPQFILLRTDRFLFLINVVSYALLPGLIFASFTRLGISKRVAWYWMWILPTGYCFVMQAGSIGNDMFAAVYLLAAIVFTLRAVARSSFPDAAIALLAAAFLTGAKASNLPLLLPLLFLMLPMLKILIRRPIRAAGVVIVAAVVSFLPIAVSNTLHTGDWSGDPLDHEQFKLKNPLAGLAGNTLEIGIGAMAPPVWPIASLWNAKTAGLFSHGPLHLLQKQYLRISLGMGELPDEEAAGLGMGVTLLLLLSLGAGFLSGTGGVTSWRALIFGGLAWISLLTLMAKFGNEGIVRLIAPYYMILPLPLLALRSQASVVRRGWWRGAALLAQLAILPALLLSPARPLLPVQSLIQSAESHGIHPPFLERLKTVYSVYANRSDQLAVVRAHLPAGAKVVGFAGTEDESEYSFWRGSGDGRVIDLKLVSPDDLWKNGIDCIVGSEWGLNDRYHLSAQEMADRIGGSILWSGGVRLFAGREPVRWYVIVPSHNQD